MDKGKHLKSITHCYIQIYALYISRVLLQEKNKHGIQFLIKEEARINMTSTQFSANKRYTVIFPVPNNFPSSA